MSVVKFSVILPVYNVRNYLKSCLDSILSQSFKNFEIILVDDGSSDGSDKICDEYASEYSNVSVTHKENGGQSSARNLGVRLAKGEYFLFIDSDDYISEGALAAFNDEISKYGIIDVVLSDGMYEVNNEGRFIKDESIWNSEDFKGINGQEAVKKLLQIQNEWSPCGKCYRTAFWRNNGFEFVEKRISEDMQLIDRVILKAERVSMVPAFYYYRSQIGGSTMHSNYYKLLNDTLWALEDWDKFLKAEKFDKELEDVIRYSHAKVYKHIVLGNLFFVDKEKRPLLYDKVKSQYYLFNYDKSTEGKVINLARKIIGIKATCKLLNVIKRRRLKKLQRG